MIHTKLHSFARLIIWRSLGALLVGYVSITPPAISGEMFRWLDEQGRVHLTDTPPQPKGVLQELKVYGFAADTGMARAWYEKAKQLGSAVALRRLEMLASGAR